MNESERQLVDLYLDGELPDAESVPLLTRLETDPQAISYLAERATLLSDLRRSLKRRHSQQWAVASTAKSSESRDVARPRNSRWFAWPPLAAAAGVVIGLFCASVAWAAALPWLSEVRQSLKVVLSESFEKGVGKTMPGLPRVVGAWSGDEAEAVTSTPAIKSQSGGKMLRFISATYPGEDSPRSQWSDVYRLVDVRGLAGAGQSVARLSASFLQDTLSPEQRFAGRAEALAIDKELSALPSPLTLAWLEQNNSAMGARGAVLTAARTWQHVSVEVPITRETRYIMLHLAMVQEQPNIHSGAVQFAGHFIDDVKMEVVSRP